MPRLTALDVVQEFCAYRGLPVPGGIGGTGQAAGRQYIAIFNRTLRDLARFRWKEQSTTVSWGAVIGQEGQLNLITGEKADLSPSLVAADYTYMVPGSFWNETRKQQVVGPVPPGVWQARKAAGDSFTPHEFAVIGGIIYILPIFTTADILSFASETKYLVQLSSGTYTDRVAQDSDTFLVPDAVIQAGFEYFWASVKGEPSGHLQAQYFDTIAASLANIPGPALSLEGTTSDRTPGILIPSGNWMTP